ncbi:hypothetical protein PM082_006076 [Marasmius tenuissimus]|nr:hypothetical protein PM082_006076 [Marasmius tenuissimus]
MRDCVWERVREQFVVFCRADKCFNHSAGYEEGWNQIEERNKKQEDWLIVGRLFQMPLSNAHLNAPFKRPFKRSSKRSSKRSFKRPFKGPFKRLFVPRSHLLPAKTSMETMTCFFVTSALFLSRTWLMYLCECEFCSPLRAGNGILMFRRRAFKRSAIAKVLYYLKFLYYIPVP